MPTVSLTDLSPAARAQAGEQIRAQQKPVAKPSKYRNVKTVLDGITFDSKREAIRYALLKLEEKAGRIWGLELQVPYPLRVFGALIATYRADFAYWRDETRIVEDVKGVRTRDYIMKKKLMKALYGIDIVEVA